MKAKIFLSCGQNRSSDEADVARKVERKIDELGFDCYMAIGRQSPRSLRENIFEEIASSDYFVFIDFKRERLKVKGRKPVCRGSLFSHQELAIAAFLDIPMLVLQEEGVERSSGMLGVIQGNAKSFSDRGQLPDSVYSLIAERVRKDGWANDSRNTLSLDVACPYFSDTPQNNGLMGRFIHIAVRNNHHRKVARHCQVYLWTIENLLTRQVTKPKLVEIKWAGTRLPSVSIGAQAIREFDVVRYDLALPVRPQFWAITDSPDYMPCLGGPGKYRLTFLVQSENFGVTSAEFILEYGVAHDSVVISKV